MREAAILVARESDRLARLRRWQVVPTIHKVSHKAAPQGVGTPRLVIDPQCLAAWPECEDGAYHPSCCRFPKACSCLILEPQGVGGPAAGSREAAAAG